MVISREITNTASANTASDIQLGSCVTEIGRGAFSGYTNISEIEFPDALTTIGEAAFSGSSIISIDISSGVTTIGNAAFSTCNGLTSVEIPDNVTTIGNYAFSTCNNVKEYTIGSGVTSIGDYAFRNNSGLTSIVVEGTTPSTLGTSAFDGSNCMIYVPFESYNTYINASGWTNYKTRISYVGAPYKVKFKNNEEETFINCDSGGSITSSEISAINISGITETIIGECATSIGSRAFTSTNLGNLKIASSALSIVDEAFFSGYYTSIRTSANTVTFEANTDLSLGYKSFYDFHCLTPIVLPKVSSMGMSDSTYCEHYLPNAPVITLNGTNSLRIPYVCYGSRNETNLLTKLTINTAKNFYGVNIPNLQELTVNNVENINWINYSGNITYARFTSSNLKKCTFGEGVKNFVGTFSGALNIENVSFPNSLESLSGNVFYNCAKLSACTFGENCSITSIPSSMFYSALTLSNFSIPSGVTYIDYQAFMHCRSLTSVALPNVLTTIGNYAFCDCINLRTCNIPSGVTEIGYGVFQGCSSLSSATIPTGITVIKDGVFSGCSSLESIDIHSGITTISASSFANCSSLKNLIIPSTVNTIGASAFTNCSGLTSIMVGRSTPPVLGASAFNGSTCFIYVPQGSYDLYVNAEGWSNYASRIYPVGENYKALLVGLTSKVVTCNDNSTLSLQEVGQNSASTINVGNCVTTIGASAFTKSVGAERIVMSNSVRSIEEYAFRRTWNSYGTALANLTDVTLSSGITSIGDYAFAYCDKLSGLTLPNTLTTIGAYSFGGCVGLTSLTIPSGVTSIPTYAFSGCSNLDIELDASVRNIYNYSLNVKSVKFKSSTPPTVAIGSSGTTPNPFTIYYGEEPPIIYVPCAYINNYLQPWPTNYSNKTYTPPYDNIRGYGQYERREVVVGAQICEGSNAYEKVAVYQSDNNVDFCFTHYEAGNLLKTDCDECLQAKVKLYYDGGTTYEMPCDGSTTLTYNNIRNNSAITPSLIVSAVYGQCVSGDSYNPTDTMGPFAKLSSLRHLYFDNSVKKLCGSSFYGSNNLEDITFYGDTPPDVGNTFGFTTYHRPIYVPYAAVDTYKANSGFTSVANYIQPIIADEKWESDEGFICESGNKYGKLAKWVSYDGTTYVKTEETKPDYDDLIESGSSVCVLHTDVQTSDGFRYSGSTDSSTYYLTNTGKVGGVSVWSATTIITFSGSTTFSFYGGVKYCGNSHGSRLIINNLNDLTTPECDCGTYGDCIIGDGIAFNCMVHEIVEMMPNGGDSIQLIVFYNLDPTIEYKIRVSYSLGGYGNSCTSQGYIAIPNS